MMHGPLNVKVVEFPTSVLLNMQTPRAVRPYRLVNIIEVSKENSVFETSVTVSLLTW